MANEISIVVRTTDAASRGFRGIGQAALGMNSAIEAAGSALDSLDAIQQSGANKAAARAQAQNDVAQALVDQKQAELDLKQATIDANQATLDASAAKKDYAEAVKKFGKGSQEAKQAQADLTQAEYDSAQATADMKQAQVDATQAQIDLNAAQRELNPTAVQQLSKKFQELAPAIGLATMAASSMSSMMNITRIRTVAVSAATKAWAVVQRVLNAVMRANPIGLVITAITLLISCLLLAYKRSDTFRAIVDKAFRAVKAAGAIMWAGLKAVFSSIGGALSSAAGKFRSFYRVSRAALNSLVGFARSVPGRIGSAFSGLYGMITNPVRNAVNAIRSWLNGLLNFARGIPGRIGGAIRGAIPGFAHGGITGAANGATSSGLTMTGENGPELLSLPPGTRVRSNPDTQRLMGQGGGGDSTITVILQGTGILEGLRKVIRVKGGTVQTVLGQ